MCRRFNGKLPRKHLSKIHSTNLIERLNAEIKHRTDVVSPILLEQNNKSTVRRYYMTLETLA